MVFGGIFCIFYLVVCIVCEVMVEKSWVYGDCVGVIVSVVEIFVFVSIIWMNNWRDLFYVLII